MRKVLQRDQQSRNGRAAAAPAEDEAENWDLQEEIAKTFRDPEIWLNTPNALLAGRKPADLIGTEDERFVRNLIGMIQHGMFT